MAEPSAGCRKVSGRLDRLYGITNNNDILTTSTTDELKSIEEDRVLITIISCGSSPPLWTL